MSLAGAKKIVEKAIQRSTGQTSAQRPTDIGSKSYGRAPESSIREFIHVGTGIKQATEGFGRYGVEEEYVDRIRKHRAKYRDYQEELGKRYINKMRRQGLDRKQRKPDVPSVLQQVRQANRDRTKDIKSWRTLMPIFGRWPANLGDVGEIGAIRQPRPIPGPPFGDVIRKMLEIPRWQPTPPPQDLPKELETCEQIARNLGIDPEKFCQERNKYIRLRG